MTNDRHVDLLVLGSGAAGMTAALTASVLGLDVLVVEKSEVVGGTSARSAGSLWVPNSRHSPPGRDNPGNALRYLRAVLGNRLDETRVRAFLAAAECIGPADPLEALISTRRLDDAVDGYVLSDDDSSHVRSPFAVLHQQREHTSTDGRCLV